MSLNETQLSMLLFVDQAARQQVLVCASIAAALRELDIRFDHCGISAF